MTRNEIQQQAINLIANNSRIVLQWCTGLGKSKASIDIIEYLKSKYNINNILLVVAEVAHKSNWDKEFIKWGIKEDITTECYASLKKYKDTSWDLIIFDEAHHLASDIRLDILSSLKVQNIVLLSATLPDQVLESVSSIFGEFAVSKVNLKQAIEWGVLPKPKVYLIPLDLNTTDYNELIVEEWGKKDKRVTYRCKLHERWEYLKNKDKYPNARIEIQCTEQQKYDYLSDQFDYWKLQYFRTRQEHTKNKWLQSGSKRKRFLGESKTSKVSILLDKLWDKRFICFCTSIEQCEALGNSNSVHSIKKDSLDIIEAFNSKKIDNLFAVGMLQEGQNLTDIEAGVIVQLDGQERAFIQKFGRSLRATDPIQFIFYYRNTRDTEYLENVLEGINEEYIIEVDNLVDLEI